MAFFGLTALGPQDAFRSSLAGMPTMHLFTEDDFLSAFARISDDGEGKWQKMRAREENRPHALGVGETVVE